MKINKILTDTNGAKLISATYVSNVKKSKPKLGSNIFFDYHRKILTIYHPSQSGRTLPFDTFKGALKYILSIR